MSLLFERLLQELKQKVINQGVVMTTRYMNVQKRIVIENVLIAIIILEINLKSL